MNDDRRELNVQLISKTFHSRILLFIANFLQNLGDHIEHVAHTPTKVLI
jgi:hypothetical protein